MKELRSFNLTKKTLFGIFLFLVFSFFFYQKAVDPLIKTKSLNKNKDSFEVYFSLTTMVGFEEMVIDSDSQGYYLSTIRNHPSVKKGHLDDESIEKIIQEIEKNNFFYLPAIFRKEPLSSTEIPYRTLVVSIPGSASKVRVERHTVPARILSIEEALREELQSLPSVTSSEEVEAMCQVFFEYFNKNKESYQKSEYFFDSCSESANAVMSGGESGL